MTRDSNSSSLPSQCRPKMSAVVVEALHPRCGEAWVNAWRAGPGMQPIGPVLIARCKVKTMVCRSPTRDDGIVRNAQQLIRDKMNVSAYTESGRGSKREE